LGKQKGRLKNGLGRAGVCVRRFQTEPASGEIRCRRISDCKHFANINILPQPHQQSATLKSHGIRSGDVVSARAGIPCALQCFVWRDTTERHENIRPAVCAAGRNLGKPRVLPNGVIPARAGILPEFQQFVYSEIIEIQPRFPPARE